MFRQLLEFNWKVFKNSLTTAKVFVLITYGLLLFLILTNFIGVVFSVVSIQNNTELFDRYRWMTPERARFILMMFVNLLWMAQFVFTNVRQLQLEENRKLLTMGYPVRTLARHLVWMRFFHPVNLLFNMVWSVFLLFRFPSVLALPLILTLVIYNYCLIFSLKLRFLNVVRDYQKWILMFATLALFLVSINLSDAVTPAYWAVLDAYIPTLNTAGLWLPGGLLLLSLQVSASAGFYLLLLAGAAGGSWLLLGDHFANTRKALQTPSGSKQHRDKSQVRKWFSSTFGSEAGKYLYYVTSHPYNRVQALFFVLFPALYLPLTLSPQSHGDIASNLIAFFFLMYVPLGFMILSVGNIFGYENRELLLHMQFPLSRVRQIRDRYLGALLLPVGAFAVITLIELILFFDSPQLLTVMLGNMFLMLCLLAIFTRSSFTHYDKIPWVSFSFTQPVVARSTAMVSGFFLIIASLIIYLPYHEYEFIKQLVLLTGIAVLAAVSYRRYLNIHNSFKTQILPRLWTEL